MAVHAAVPPPRDRALLKLRQDTRAALGLQALRRCARLSDCLPGQQPRARVQRNRGPLASAVRGVGGGGASGAGREIDDPELRLGRMTDVLSQLIRAHLMCWYSHTPAP